MTPGTPGALIVMLAEFGTLSLADVLAPSIALADGYAIDAETADRIELEKDKLKQWRYSKAVMLPHLGQAREAPVAGEIFRQAELAATLRKLVEAESNALKAGKSRKEALQAAYDRFYRGDIAEEFVRGAREEGALITASDLANWQVKFEEPRQANYRGIDVYKLDSWTQGPVMLQALNILENFDLKSMGYNSGNYIHTVYQAMNLAFADRDFYYGDPAFPPERADGGPALGGLREVARGGHLARRRQRSRDRPRRSVSVPGRHEPARGAAEEARDRGRAGVRRGALRRGHRSRHRLLLSRHDFGRRRRQGRLARLDDALGRLAARRDRRAAPASA